MEHVSVDDNYYTRLELSLGASTEAVEEAFARLDAEARNAGDLDRCRRLEEARRGLLQPGIRSYHNQRIKWDAARIWYESKYPEGRSVEEHRLWADYRRAVIETEPSLWSRVKDLFDGG